MKDIFIVFICLFGLNTTAQISFVGFSSPNCSQPMTNVYTYTNTSSGSGSGSWHSITIYRNGTPVYNDGGQASGGMFGHELIFINDSTGFFVYRAYSSGIKLIKTTDYGVTWNLIGQGGPSYSGLYIVNANFAYLVTNMAGTSSPNVVQVTRCSDIQPPQWNFIFDGLVDSDKYAMDTVLNGSLCNIDSLNIFIKNSVGDTITYHINKFIPIMGLPINPSPFGCPGHVINIPFAAVAAFNSGNVFTAQLSDASGGFSTPVNIGNIASTTSGTISAVISSTVALGSNYKIRVVSSSPIYFGTDNGAKITINNNLPALTLGGNINGSSTQTLSGIGPNNLCAGQYAYIFASGATTYTWNNGANSTNIFVTPTISTIYSVTGENACGISSDSIKINVYNPPIVSVSGASFCPGANSVTLTASGALTYTWSAFPSITVIGPTYVINSNINAWTSYSVKGSDGYCTSTSVGGYLIAQTAPNISFSGADQICIGSSANINAYGAQTYTWQNGATTSSIAVTPSASTTYSLVGENECGISNASVLVDVSSNSPGVFISGNDSICIGSGTTLSGWCPGAMTYTWSNGSILPAIDVSPITNTTYTLFAENACGISSSSYLVDVDSTCQFVWPGDANSDGLVNNIDVLELGLHYSQVGPPRTIQGDQWLAFRANNWSDTITNGKNLNHSDCNGDGVISADDTLAIYNNYSYTHAFKVSSANNTPSFSIIPHELSVYKGQWGSSSIILADSLNPVDSLNGIAFSILFDSSLLESDSIYITYKDGFFGLANQNLNFKKLNFPHYRIYAATTHTNNNNVSGYGEIATIHYKIDPLLNSNQHFWLQIIDGFKMDNLGQVSSLGGCYMQGGYIDATIVSIEEMAKRKCSIIPNPTNGFVTVNTSEILKEVEISSVESKMLLKYKCDGTSTQIDLTGYNAGLYFLKISLVGGESFIRKIILTK